MKYITFYEPTKNAPNYISAGVGCRSFADDAAIPAVDAAFPSGVLGDQEGSERDEDSESGTAGDV